jgi:hypothetical protein
VHVDFASKTATVTMKPGKSATKQTFDAAFRESRYSVSTFTAK